MYEQIFRCKWLGDDSKTLEEIALKLEAAAKDLREMAKDGIHMDADLPMADDYAFLYTDDPLVAEKYGFHEQEEEEE